MPCVWPVIQPIPVRLRSSVWDEHETFLDRDGQALVVLVHVFLRREIRHALLTGVLSDVDECCRDTYTAKACHALHIRRIEHISSRPDHEML